ncbi:MAG: deoxyribonuclease IV, partial [Armatimonadota bacterium]|nr:deoxyribonuclease IV [Armatimonadota bacterium]
FLAALQRAQELECGCLQIFCKSPRQWQAPPLDQAKADAFRAAWCEAGLKPLVAHDSYLINLAAPDEASRQKSMEAMIDEVERADALGCDYLVTHCGAHLQPDGGDAAEEAGLRRLADSLRVVLKRTPQAQVRIALENTCGQGTCLGGPFEHLASVLNELHSDRLAVCFDTCHAFAAGHDMATAAGLEDTLRKFDRSVGLDKLGVIHLNDSKGQLGRHLDRHEHIGQGNIGREGMARIVNHPRLKDLPFILETPDMETMDRINLQTVRSLRQR